MSSRSFDPCFLTPDSVADYRAAIDGAVETLIRHYAGRDRVYGGASAPSLAASMTGLEICPDQGIGLSAVLDEIGPLILDHSLVLTNPTCMAHLHCPPLLPALSAEVLITATNPSMDSWDQAPAATYLEQEMVDWLCRLYGFADGDGTFTSGGTQSNMMGVLFARDSFARDRLGWDIQKKGLPPEAPRFRILASEVAHFSIRQSAALLGLGHQAVVSVPVDADQRMDVAAADQIITDLLAEGLLPIAISATAGTTDFGSVDPLDQLADLADRHQLWLHVDAAYGGALVLSDLHRGRLAGVERADSLTVDFHKMFYQPISCGAFLARERGRFDLIALTADYLNPEENVEYGILDLVGKSVQTTRRFDALKLYMSLRALGRQTMAAMVEGSMQLAQDVARDISGRPNFRLATWPSLNSVVFRYQPSGMDDVTCDQHLTAARMALLAEGAALMAQTRVNGLIHLKMTLLNPRARLADIQSVLERLQSLV